MKNALWSKEHILKRAAEQSQKFGDGNNALLQLLTETFSKDTLDEFYLTTSHYDVWVFRDVKAASGSNPSHLELSLLEKNLVAIDLWCYPSLRERGATTCGCKLRWVGTVDLAHEVLSAFARALRGLEDMPTMTLSELMPLIFTDGRVSNG